MSSPTYLLNQAANRVGGAGCSRQTSYARRESSLASGVAISFARQYHLRWLWPAPYH
jgi:hypothetical protein